MLRLATMQRRVGGSCQALRAYGTSLPVPKPPAGTGVVFHSQMQLPKWSLSNPRWFGLLFVMNAGAYSGNWFYNRFILRENPPNPPRNPENPGAPEKHMHTVDED